MDETPNSKPAHKSRLREWYRAALRPRLKRLVNDRFAMSAALFLVVLAAGAFSALFGVLDAAAPCAGFMRPVSTKLDPTRPHSEQASRPLPAAALDTPAPVDGWAEQISQSTAAAELAVQSALTDQHLLIQLYGGFQRLTDRTVVEDVAEPQYAVARLESGALTFTSDDVIDPAAQAASLKRLEHILDERDIPLLYLQAPSKITDGDRLPVGITDTSNANADAFLAALDENGIDYLDFRQVLKDAGGSWADWFYVTDHHWNQEGAFTAFQALCEKLEDYDLRSSVARGEKRSPITIDESLTKRESYDITTLPDVFLGSQGKRVGSLYAGMDDFALWVPNFPTLLRYNAALPPGHGDAEHTVLFPQRLEERDPFAGNPYTYYSGGDYAFTEIKNFYNPQGPKVLLLRDSFACAITPYLSYACSELYTLDPRYYSGDILTVLDWKKPDLVLVMYSPGLLQNSAAFSFLPQASSPSKADVLRWEQD